MKNHTLSPIVTGSSVLGLRYADGVMLVCDTLASYGSSKKFTGVQRLHKIGSETVMGASGEFSDFQYVCDLLDEAAKSDEYRDDGVKRSPAEWASYLRTIYYQRRNKMNPLFNSILIAGINEETGESFLGCVDLFGTFYKDDVLATGFGSHLAIPLMRERAKPDMSETEAVALLEECMRVLYYRDCRATDKIQFAKVTRTGGSEISRSITISSKWDHSLWLTPTIGVADMLGASW